MFISVTLDEYNVERAFKRALDMVPDEVTVELVSVTAKQKSQEMCYTFKFKFWEG